MEPGRCGTCGTTIRAGIELCALCGGKLGLTAGDAARPIHPCTRCNHGEFVRALVRELREPSGSMGASVAGPMAVSYRPAYRVGMLSNQVKGVIGVDLDEVYGILEMYVCLKCGLTEWYCRDPQSIPIGPEYGTEKVDAGPKTPYR